MKGQGYLHTCTLCGQSTSYTLNMQLRMHRANGRRRKQMTDHSNVKHCKIYLTKHPIYQHKYAYVLKHLFYLEAMIDITRELAEI